MPSKEEMYSNVVQNAHDGFKKRMYDFVTVIILMAIIMASLHVFGFNNFEDVTDWKSYIMDWLPYFVAAIMLNDNLYQKGVFVGKSTQIYTKAISAYSKDVTDLTGEQLEFLQVFCDEYNDKSLKRMQTEILKRGAISYDAFNTNYVNKDVEYGPLRDLSKTRLDELLGKEKRKIIIKAKRTHVKRLNVNILLGNANVNDPTDIGQTESELTKMANCKSTLTYLFSTALMSLIVINDLATWGWSTLIVVIFKVMFLLGKTLMSYFKGYNATVVNLVSHVIRKTDILKEFNAWYSNKIKV